jgi:hypothetical protein
MVEASDGGSVCERRVEVKGDVEGQQEITQGGRERGR